MASEILTTTTQNTEGYGAPANPSLGTFPDAWSERGLLLGTDGRPHRPNGEFASRREVCAYLASLLMEHTVGNSMQETVELSILSQRQESSASGVPQEITDPDFYNKVASQRVGDTSDDIFAPTTGTRYQVGLQRSSHPKINLGGNWTGVKRKPRTTRRLPSGA